MFNSEAYQLFERNNLTVKPIIQIVAVGRNKTIGNNNELPWKLSKDLKFFRDMTKGHTVIMGRKTYESIGKPLPDRQNIVLTRDKRIIEGLCGWDLVNYQAYDIDDAFAYIRYRSHGSLVFIIGGAEIYKQTIRYTDAIILTWIDKDFEGNIKYLDIPKNFIKHQEEELVDNNISCKRFIYIRDNVNEEILRNSIRIGLGTE